MFQGSYDRIRLRKLEGFENGAAPTLKKDPQIGKVASFSRIPPPDSLTRIVTAKRP